MIAEFQRRLVKPICEKFLPIYQTSAGPKEKALYRSRGIRIHEEDPDVIIREALENRKISPNICCKIPTTQAGLQAMQYLIGQDIPLNATEIFGNSPSCGVVRDIPKSKPETWAGADPIHLPHCRNLRRLPADVVRKENIDISPDVLWQAGLAVARKLYQIMDDRHYPGIFVAGGARGLHHFTEMVGGKVCCTINWEGTADRLLEQDPPVVYRLFNPVPQKVIDELIEKLPDFKRGYLEDGLEIEEFERFRSGSPVSERLYQKLEAGFGSDQ